MLPMLLQFILEGAAIDVFLPNISIVATSFSHSGYHCKQN